MFGFKKKEGPTLGVDINSDSITLAELDKTRLAVEMVRFSCIPTPANTVKEGLVADPSTVGMVIMDLLEQSGIAPSGPSPTMNMTIPAQSAVIRLMPVPTGMPAEELAEVVTQEATNHVPFPISDANLDWSLMPATERTDPDGVRRVDVIIAAVQRSIIDTCWRTADSAGVKLGRVEISSLAAIRGLALAGYDDPEKVCMVVQIRQDATDINILRNSMPLFGRSVIIGIETLTEAVSRSLEIDFEQALNLLPEIPLFGRPPKDEQTGQAAQVARTIFSDITDELERSKEFYESQVGEVHVDQIILTGPGCMLSNLDQYVKSRMGHDTVYGNALRGIDFDKSLIVERMQPILASLIGSAVDPAWNPNFTVDLDLNKEGRTAHTLDERKTQLIVEPKAPLDWYQPTLITGAIVLLITCAYWIYEIAVDIPSKNSEIASLSEKIKQGQDSLKHLSKMREANTTLDTRKKVLKYLVHSSRKWSRYLDTIQDNTPGNVQIDHVVLDASAVEIQGLARNFKAVSELAINLDASPLVNSANVKFATRKDRSPQLVTFSIFLDVARTRARQQARSTRSDSQMDQKEARSPQISLGSGGVR